MSCSNQHFQLSAATENYKGDVTKHLLHH